MEKLEYSITNIFKLPVDFKWQNFAPTSFMWCQQYILP